MTKNQKWFVLIALVLGVAGGSLIAQLQQSGGPGSTVTANAGTGPATPWKVDLTSTGANATAIKVDGSGVTQPVSGTFWQATQPVSIASMPSTPVTGTFWQATQPTSLAALPALAAGTNTIGKAADLTTCGTTPFSQAWVAVPTTSTSITSTTTCVKAIVFSNTNATPQTVTVTDGQGSPVTVVPALSIPGNSQVTFPFFGAPMTTGIKWSAGGSGVTGAAVGVQ